MRISSGLVFIAGLVIVTGARAQPASTTRTVKITFTGTTACKSRIPGDINVVLEGKEQDAFTVPRKTPDPLWIGSIPDKLKPIMAAGTRASLRLNGLRTNCGKSIRIPADSDPVASVASFTFECDEEEAHSVKFQTNPEANDGNRIAIGYTRWVHEADCKDWAFLPKGPQTVEDIWKSEDVRLHLAWRKANVDAPGLLVLSPSKSSILSFSRHAKKKDDRLMLGREGIVATLIDQRAHADAGPPVLSLSAIDIDTKQLKKEGISELSMTVVK
jgi:hypothetical protein